jgi:hypothetical protein
MQPSPQSFVFLAENRKNEKRAICARMYLGPVVGDAAT